MNDNNQLVQNNGEDNMIAIMQEAPNALLMNKEVVTKVVEGCKRLIAKAKAQGMTDELDKLLNDAQVRTKMRYDEAKDRRSPVTKWFDEIRSEFTALEALIDPAKKESVYGEIQALRNAYATQKKEEENKRRADADKKLKADNEKINLKAEADLQLRNSFLNDLESAKQLLQDVFNSTTLTNYKEHLDKITKWDDIYHINEFNALYISLRAVYLSTPELESIKLNSRIGKFDNWSIEYKGAINTMKLDLLDKMPGKKTELEAIANANAEEKKRLQKIADDRKIAEDEKAKKDSEDAKLKSAQDIEANKQVELTNTLFDNAVELAANTEKNAPVESYEIEITNPAAWLLIAQFWFTNEGAKLPTEDIEKKTYKQQKTFCEKWYKSHDKQGLSSPYIIYKPVYKAIAKK